MFGQSCRTQPLCWAVLVALTALSCDGCGAFVTPMRAPTHNYGAAGEGPNGKLSLSFIQVGKTNREEVIQKLGWTNTGLKDDRLFLGRWASSSWGVYSMAGMGTEVAEDWNRHWGAHNMLIEFDEKGLVRKYRIVPDSELIKALDAIVAQSPGRPLDLSKPMEISVALRGQKDEYYEGSLVLGKDSFGFRQGDTAGIHNFEISRNQIQKLSLTSLPHTHWSHTGLREGPYARYISAVIHFTDKSKANSVTMRVDLPVVMLLIEYLAEASHARAGDSISLNPDLELAVMSG